MIIDKLDNNILVAKYDNFYLIYSFYKAYNYYLAYEQNKETKTTTNLKIESNAQDLFNIVNANDYGGINIIIGKKRKNETEKDLICLYEQIKGKDLNINAEVVLYELIYELNDYLEEFIKTKKNPFDFNSIKNKKIINKIIEISDKITKDKNSEIYLADGGKKGEIVQIIGNEELKDGLYYKFLPREGNYIYTLIGNLLIHEFKLIYDKLGLFNPVATIKYTNTTTDKTITLKKKPYEEISNHLINNRLIDSNNMGIENLLNKIWVQGVNEIEFITAETDLIKDGFFMDMENNKVLLNNVFKNLNTSPDDVSKAINLFNDIIKDRGTAIPNDCTLFRFMLWSPFAYCLKQLGFTDGLYSVVLWGVTNTNKTGSSKMFSYLYTDKETTLQKANTQSAIGTRLGENTFPLILDEAKDNLINPNDEEFNKNIVTDKTGRAVKDRANNNLMIEFPALRATVRTLNQNIEYKEEFLKRHKVLYYDKSMQVKEVETFNKKFKPNTPNTPLKQLRHLGKVFAEKFIIYLENQSEKLYEPEDLTIKILSEIEKEYDTQFNFNVLIKQEIKSQSLDKSSIIQNGLNNIFRKGYKIPYGHNAYMGVDFINAVDIGVINWLDYQPRTELFLIKINEFEKDISNITGEHLPIAETMKLLNITYEYKERQKFKNNSVPCVKLDMYNLTYKLFGINIYSADELEELQNSEKRK